MQLLAFLICDNYSFEEGTHTFDLHKAGLSKFSLPPKEPGMEMTILVSLGLDPIETGEKTIKLHYRDSDGQDIAPPFEQVIELYALPINHHFIDFACKNPGPGHYSLDLFLSDEFLASYPLEFA